MKTKYERMSKEEKRELYLEYKNEKNVFANKMEKMFVLCYLGTGYSIVSFIYDYFYKNSKVGYVLDIVVFLFCIFALLKVISIKKSLLNKYAIEKDKNRKKIIKNKKDL